MWITWDKKVHHDGTIYGHDINNEMQNKTKVSIPKPEYTEYLQSKHKQCLELLHLKISSLNEASEAKIVMLTQAV